METGRTHSGENVFSTCQTWKNIPSKGRGVLKDSFKELLSLAVRLVAGFLPKIREGVGRRRATSTTKWLP